MQKRLRVNQQIRVPQVRLVDEKGQQIGVIELYRAQQMAQEKGLDLVEVYPNAQPPVCKIMDYGSYQFTQAKKERKQRAKQKKIEVKGIRLSLNIAAHDMELRKNQSLKFFQKGDKVKVEIILRGRERNFVARAEDIMREFAKSLGESVFIEQPIARQGGRLSMLLAKK